MKINLLAQSLSLGIKNSLLCWVLSIAFSVNAFAAPSDAELLKKIKDIERSSNAIIGISAIYIEKNKVIAHNSNQPFFMASTIKLPIAITFLQRVDEKKDSLNRVIKMDSRNSVPGSGALHYLFEKKKLSITLKQILMHTLKNSDNSASDALLKAVNGPRYVAKRMKDLGLQNMFINRSIMEMFVDTNHVDRSFLKNRQPIYSWQKISNRVPLKEKQQAWQRFQKDKRDTTTPNDMAKLLVKLFKKQALSESSTNLLMKIMEQCRTGRSRIRGLLPGNVKVAHKTGTWSIYERDYLRYPGSRKLYRFVSDVGIITLPHNKGHIALAVYVKSQSASDYTRSRAIALTSRAIYDYFMKS